MTRTTVVEQSVIAPLEERTRARLITLKENRERFVNEAQRQLAALDAAIAELGALLDPAEVANQNGTVPDAGSA